MIYDLVADEAVEVLATLMPNVKIVEATTQDTSQVLAYLPPWVRELSFHDCTFREAPVFPDTLRKISFHRCDTVVALDEWRFVDRINNVEIDGCTPAFNELSRVPVHRLTLRNPRGDSRRMQLPLSLDSLVLDRAQYRTLPTFPASLHSLTLFACEQLITHRGAALAPIKHLQLIMTTVTDFYVNYPEVERLILSKVSTRDRRPITISSSHLTELILSDVKEVGRLTLNAPNLESFRMNHSDVEVEDYWGDSVREVALQNARGFVIPEAWTNLVDVSIKNGTGGQEEYENTIYSLDWLPSLRRLQIDARVETNGVEVGDLREYRRAWSYLRKKPAQRL